MGIAKCYLPYAAPWVHVISTFNIADACKDVDTRHLQALLALFNSRALLECTYTVEAADMLQPSPGGGVISNAGS